MKRPIESDYASHVAYNRALEEYCDSLEKQTQLKRGPIGFDQTRLISQLSNMYLVGHHDGKKSAQREWIGLTPKNTEGFTSQ